MNKWAAAGTDLRVSVLVTTFNHEAYVAKALDSVLEQRVAGGYEILVGDDGSTDGTRQIIESYAARHPALIRCFFPEANLGGGGKSIFDELIKMSRGRYLAGLDGDDYWTSDHKLQIQADYLDGHPECSMCFHNAVRHFEFDGERPDILYNPVDQSRTLTVTDLLTTNPVASCTPLSRRSVLEPLPPWYFTLPWGDWPLYFLAIAMGEIHFLPNVMGVYRIHEGGMYSGVPLDRQLRDHVVFLEGIQDVVPESGEQVRRRQVAMKLARLAHLQLAAGDRSAAKDSIHRSFSAWGPDIRLLGRGHGERWRIAQWLAIAGSRRGSRLEDFENRSNIRATEASRAGASDARRGTP